MPVTQRGMVDCATRLLRVAPRMMQCASYVTRQSWLFWLVAALLMVLWLPRVQAQQTAYYVAPSGDDGNPGTFDAPFATIQKALDVADVGSVIYLAPGEYREDLRTRRDGLPSRMITITGPRSAIVKGNDGSRVFQINHGYIALDGFTIDGAVGDGTFRDVLIFVQSTQVQTPLRGVQIRNMALANANDQCIRLRYYVQDAEIAYNTVRACGQEDFPNGIWAGGGKNGVAIYVGTPLDQLDRNPDPAPDVSQGIHIHHNILDAQSAKCIETREHSSHVLIEYNDCRGHLDPDAAGINIRGNRNLIRYNTVYDGTGAGIRLGGETEAFGTDNLIHGNILVRNLYGALNIQRQPQRAICGNALLGNGDRVGRYGDDYPLAQPCAPDVAEEMMALGELCTCVSGPVRAFWEQQGGISLFGLPITPLQMELVEGEPKLVQWFERARIEVHPQDASPPYTLLPGRIGVERLAQQGYDWQAVPREESRTDCRYFAETGRNVCGDILTTWQAHGLELDGQVGFSEAENVALFGLPITGMISETLDGGQVYQVQYFERARLELHPENQPPLNVMVGLLGRELREER